MKKLALFAIIALTACIDTTAQNKVYLFLLVIVN
jgi:hypothetical protein